MVCIIFSLVGCGQKSKFYYEEEAFTNKHKEIRGFTNDEYKNMYILLRNNKVIQYDEKGQEIKEIKLEISKDSYDIPFAIGKDEEKNLYVDIREVGPKKPEKEQIHEIWKLDEKGKNIKKIPIAQNDMGGWENRDFGRIYITKNKHILYKNDSNILLEIDEKGNIVNTLIKANVKDFVKVENSIYAVIREEEGISLVKKGMNGNNFVFKKKIGESSNIAKLDFDPQEKKLLYFSDKMIVESFDMEGNSLGTAIDGENAPILLTNGYMNGLIVNDQGTVFMNFITAEGKFKILMLKKKEGTPPKNNKKVIKVGVNTRYQQDEIKELAMKYMKKNPNIVIKVNQYDYKEDYLSDYLKKMNTKMLSGEGDDLIPTEYLPMKKFIKSEIFENLKDYMGKDKDFDINDYYKTVVDSYQYKNNYYALPINFTIGGFIADQKLLDEKNIKIDKKSWNRESFMKALREISKNNGTYGLVKMDKKDLIEMFFLGEIDKWIDYENKKANFNNEDFKGLLKDVEAIYDEKLYHNEIERMMDLGSEKRMGEVAFVNKKNIEIIGIDGFDQIKNDIENYQLYPYPTEKGKGEFTYEPFGYGLNRQSKNKEIAWDFLKFMANNYCGDDFESKFSVNKKNNIERLEKCEKKEKEPRAYCSEDYIVYSYPLTEEEVNQVKNALENIKIDVSLDPQIRSILKDSFEKYVKRELSQEELLQNLDNKITTYLNE
jgi:multiple sugar transport system substrate-binding protein